MLSGVEKFMATTLGVVALALVLTNPQGDQAAGNALVNIYQGVVSAFFKPTT